MLALVLVSAAQGALGQSTGLILTPADKLRGIPLASTPFSGTELPPAVDLSSQLPPPGNQGAQQSCVGWAVAYGLKSYQEQGEERWPLADRAGAPDPSHVFSPSFIYNQLNQGRDGGCSLPDALNLLHERGAATLADMPYDASDHRRQPDARASTAAKRFRIDYWRQVNIGDLLEVKAQLNAGYPVVIGAEVDQGFVTADAGTVWKARTGSSRGGHAMLLVGYDDRRHAFKLLNSWGSTWGDRGYGWIDYDHFGRVVREAFVAKDAINGPGPETPVLTPPATPPAPVVFEPSFFLTNIVHNLKDASGTLWMRLEGSAGIPPGMGRSGQVVVYFFFDAGGGQKGWAVGSTQVRFSDVNGFAATGTPPFSIPSEGMTTSWWATIPYNALVLQAGYWGTDAYGSQMYFPVQNRLVLEPVLYVDGFGVLSGGLAPFFISW
jgi:hypothetical protein